MINNNGKLEENSNELALNNRGYKYGDALFETMKFMNGKLLFFEDHYFRLMSSMRILRMEIPMNFTMEFIEAEILKTITINQLSDSNARVRFNVNRAGAGRYLPKKHTISYTIEVESLSSDYYTIIRDSSVLVDLYKDFYVAEGLLSSLKTNNKVIHVLASIYAKENDFDSCLLLNNKKQVVEAISGNLFLVKGSVIKTPPIDDGCLKGVMRKQIIEMVHKHDLGYTIEEASISPFELQKADELFISNVIVGIMPITAYRKKCYTNEVSSLLTDQINKTLVTS